MLELSQLQVDYRGRSVLAGLEACWEPGQVVGLVGPNGCGKSTLLRAIAQLVAHRGSIRVAGQQLSALSAAERARCVSYMPQQVHFSQPFLVRELVNMSRFAYQGRWGGGPDPLVDAVLERVGLTHLASRPAQQLSGGEAQRVRLAQALAQDASWILLDEPTSALDLQQQLEILNLLRELRTEGKSLLLVSHDLNFARQLCDQLVLLGEGRLLAQGKPDAVLQHAEFERIFQVRMEVFRNSSGGSMVSPFQV